MFTSDHETPLPQDNIEALNLLINKTESKTDKIYDFYKYVQSLATEVEAMKLFMKKEFYLLKKCDLGN